MIPAAPKWPGALQASGQPKDFPATRAYLSRKSCELIVSALVSGLLILAPIYLAVLLLLKAMQSLVASVKPFAMLLPEWFPAENVFSLLLVLIVCFLIGLAVRTPQGERLGNESRVLYSRDSPATHSLRSLTQRLAGQE